MKKLSAVSRQGGGEFINEVSLITKVQHKNLVKLRGCCVMGKERLLVYEYMENKSLHEALFGNPLHFTSKQVQPRHLSHKLYRNFIRLCSSYT